MLLEILKYPDAELKKVCAEVPEITPEIRQLASDMAETMYASRGVGLAAPQIGKHIRMLVMDPQAVEEEKDLRILINPVLELGGEKIVSEQEGCLSVPLNFRADMPRYSQARVRALDLDGNRIDEVYKDYAAIIVQHEVDHLDGKLFIDNISHLKRSIYDGKVKKWLKQKQQE